MEPFVEKRGAGFYLISEGNGNISRDEILIRNGAGKLAVGTVLGVDGDGEYAPVDLGASDGTEVAVAVLWGAVDATDVEVRAAANTRLCEVLGAELVYPEYSVAEDVETINGQLAAVGIIVR